MIQINNQGINRLINYQFYLNFINLEGKLYLNDLTVLIYINILNENNLSYYLKLD